MSLRVFIRGSARKAAQRFTNELVDNTELSVAFVNRRRDANITVTIGAPRRGQVPTDLQFAANADMFHAAITTLRCYAAGRAQARSKELRSSIAAPSN